jgi:hypothetical protein
LKILDELVGNSGGPWRWFRAAAIGFAIAFLILFVKAAWVNFTDPRTIDFLSYWAAAKLAVGGHAPLAYDVNVHRQVETTAVSLYGLLPFPYPPPFLLLLLPFGIPSYGVSFPLWVVTTGLLYVLASRPASSPSFALAQPAVFLNEIQGQNGFLTCGIFMLAASALPTAPYLAGAIWGLLIIKPQLALLLPVALIAGREWKAIAGGAFSAIAVSLLALLVLGTEAYKGFFQILPLYGQWMATSEWPWQKLASPFAMLRYFDVPQTAALIVHAAIAVGAAFVTWRAWARALPQRVPVLAAATLLVSPYTLTYDSLLLLAPLAWLMKQKRQPYAVAVVWIMLLPVGLLNGPYHGPNTVPVACLICLWALHHERVGDSGRIRVLS